MADTNTIREIAERNVRVLRAKPAKGQLTGTTTARLIDGLRSEITEGPWRLTADMPVKGGGDGAGPTPGTLGRGALGSCLIVIIAMWAARLGISLNALEVEVQADFDARGELGMDDVPAGYKEVRYTVTIDSPAPRRALEDLLDLAERDSPYVHVFGDTTPLRRSLRLTGQSA